ncbi:pentapeptide repeat-containing protein [Limnoraphis robusta]|uniref:Pentapeptide repeat-containing protein n=1 Tax=Limnoraphis robusta CCNP1315 TaxID=3110306 RepID=A0ABU5TSP2_9CYAN|nr:pentapeptide repeat-containing protein [Limnoraphis robusta]MEA5517915.1 pentapeptide repeat-containing protein [Limnoraphis robusta CCNP1315]MEA5549258.1 pentapeptide repeat-containing protein [Limnoraphis robusta CCNP1324]
MSIAIPDLAERPIYSLTYLLLLITFFGLTALQGFQRGLYTTSITITVIAFVSGVMQLHPGFRIQIMSEILSSLMITPQAIIFAVPGISAIALLSATGIILFGFSTAPATIIFTISGSVLAAISSLSIATDEPLATILVGIATLIANYIALRGLAGDQKFAFVRPMAIAIATWRGTSFRGADLTDADFTGAELKSTDFREANLTRTRWFQAKGLDLARVGNSYLQHLQIQKLVTTLEGQGQNFDKMILTGINLKDANLQDTSFIGADLNHANLQNADLSRAILKQTQLDGADLTGAILTGAYIEDWGITGETKLDGVQCEYIFMRVPTKSNPNPLRKPDNWRAVFLDGEFANFIKPYIDTLDLYHSQDVDPRAISLAFKNLSENNPDAELQIVAMEKRGQNSFNLKVKTASTADKSELSAEYFEDYNHFRVLPSSAKFLLAEKDARIRSLEDIIGTAIKQPTFDAPKVKILFLAADPTDTVRLRLGQELRDIREKLQLSKQRNSFVLESRESVRPGDITQAIYDVAPQIVHFCGHGTSQGELCFENNLGQAKSVEPEALASLFELIAEKVSCVVLNACYSEVQAEAISKHIPFVIGMNKAISDQAAITFTVGFYKALGGGHSFEKAYKFAIVEMQLEGIPENLIPVLYRKDDINTPIILDKPS